MVRPTGFEPAAFRVGVWRAIQLRHGRVPIHLLLYPADKTTAGEPQELVYSIFAYL